MGRLFASLLPAPFALHAGRRSLIFPEVTSVVDRLENINREECM